MFPLVSQNRHVGCEQLDGEADDGLYANSGKLGLDEPTVNPRLTRAGDQSQRRPGARPDPAPTRSSNRMVRVVVGRGNWTREGRRVGHGFWARKGLETTGVKAGAALVRGSG
jgi:hypothetical protein